MRAAAATDGLEPFPWEAAIPAGLARLRLAPRDFWAMTPRELSAALAPPGGPWPLRRGELAALMEAFPEEEEDGDEG